MNANSPINATSSIALVGFMGAGKTSVGLALSRLTSMSFVDADIKIENSLQMPISRIFEKYGEGHFRSLEREFYSKLDFANGGIIMATGGGAILDARTGATLRKHTTVVYLAARPQTILARIGQNDSTRPLLQGDNVIDKIAALIAERDTLYREASHFIVDTNDLDVETCAKSILRFFGIKQQSLLP